MQFTQNEAPANQMLSRSYFMVDQNLVLFYLHNSINLTKSPTNASPNHNRVTVFHRWLYTPLNLTFIHSRQQGLKVSNADSLPHFHLQFKLIFSPVLE